MTLYVQRDLYMDLGARLSEAVLRHLGVKVFKRMLVFLLSTPIKFTKSIFFVYKLGRLGVLFDIELIFFNVAIVVCISEQENNVLTLERILFTRVVFRSPLQKIEASQWDIQIYVKLPCMIWHLYPCEDFAEHYTKLYISRIWLLSNLLNR